MGPSLSMHTPIDVDVAAARDGVVLGLAPARPAWRLGSIVWRAGRALERPAGTIAASGTRLDDRLVVVRIDREVD